MGGLDPQTALALGIAGVTATVLASLIAMVSNLIGQRIQRGTARQVAQIQAEAQRGLDHRKAVREYREALIAPLRQVASRRSTLLLRVTGTAEQFQRQQVREFLDQVEAEMVVTNLSFWGVASDELIKCAAA